MILSQCQSSRLLIFCWKNKHLGKKAERQRYQWEEEEKIKNGWTPMGFHSVQREPGSDKVKRGVLRIRFSGKTRKDINWMIFFRKKGNFWHVDKNCEKGEVNFRSPVSLNFHLKHLWSHLWSRSEGRGGRRGFFFFFFFFLVIGQKINWYFFADCKLQFIL